MNKKNENKNADEFVQTMMNVERETLLKINEISRKFNMDTFHTVEAFSVHLIEINGKLKEKCEKAAQATENDYEIK